MIAHIFKYEIPITDKIVCIELPDKYGLCDIQNQDDKIYMWAVVDTHATLIKRYFKVLGTGHQITGIEYLYFLRTIVMPNGFVWHIFEVVGPNE